MKKKIHLFFYENMAEDNKNKKIKHEYLRHVFLEKKVLLHHSPYHTLKKYKERERERKREGGREKERGSERERDRERERERQKEK